MKSIAFIFVVIFMLSSCSFYSKKSNADADYKEEKNLNVNSSNQISEGKFARNVEKETSPEIEKAKAVLNKKINKETFEKDIEIIRRSNLYDSLVCASLKSNVMLNGYSGSSLNMTYKSALEASKEGKERARRIHSFVSE